MKTFTRKMEHMSTEDVSPQSFEQRGSSYYDRNSRLVTETDQYIRRPNNYHPGDLRGRARDRLYRNGPYSSIIDRTTPVHHRVSTWYETGTSGISSISGQAATSPAPRSVYGNVASAVVQPDSSIYDCQLLKKKKSRSGSESPCGGSGSINAPSSHSSHIVDRGNGGSAASSRSHSRSPSSCSSTNSTSSNSHASSPVSGSDPPLSSSSRTRNLQSAVSAPNQSGMTVNNQSSNTNAGSSSSSSTGNPVVHSEDNRPLAICVRNLPARSSDTSLKDGLFHEYKKHGKVTWVKVVGQNAERYALVCFKKPDDVDKALEVSHDKLFFGCKIEVAPYQGYDVEDNEFRPYEAELDEYHPKSTRTLFIGNLEKDITGSDIRNHFECFGEIIEIDIKKQGLNAYAFCQYSDIVSVVKAMRKMDGEHLGNNRIKLGFGKSMPTNCVWIDGIADSVTESYLSGQFARYGPITEVVIDRERKLALVSFEQVQYAQLAVKEMRGATIRGRKLQVDFASRECRDKFCNKVEKQTAGSSCNSTDRTNLVPAETTSYVVSVPGTRFGRYESQTTRSRASSFSRHSNVNSTSGAASPSSIGGTPSSTSVAACQGGGGAIGSGSSSIAGGSTPRGSRTRGVRHGDYDYSEQKFRSYDEYSQGSGASHDDESYGYASNCTRPDSPQSRLGLSAGSILDTLDVSSTNSGRRRCDKSPGDIRNLQKERFHLLEQLEECPSSGDELVSPKKRMKFDHSSHHHNHHHTIPSLVSVNNPQPQIHHHQQQPLQTQSQQQHQIDCSTNSNNTSSSLQPTNLLIGESNCDVLSNHSNETSSTLHHRKCVEVRRLSECSSLKYGTQMSASTSNSRRPSTESGGIIGTSIRHSGHEHNSSTAGTTTVYAAPHSLPCKRRRTGASITAPASTAGTGSDSNSEFHSSRGRGHQLHSHHSHEASGGESADGSRPGTPLCDERPEVLPSEPRRIPRDKPHEPMMLELPKFGEQFFLQNRVSAVSAVVSSASSLHTGQLYSISSSSSSTNINNLLSTNSSSTLLNSKSNQSSLSNTLSSPPLLGGTRLSTSSFHHPTQQQPSHLTMHQSSSHHQTSQFQQQLQPHHHHHHQHHHGPTQSLHYHHVSTAGVEQPPSSPLRPRSLSSNSSDSDAAPMSTSPSIEERIKTLDEMYEKWSGGGSMSVRSYSQNVEILHNSSSSYSSRHKFLELDVNEVKPSEIVKSVLAKKSIFDDDLQRLKNISDKYEPGDFSNISRGSLASTSPGIPNLAATKTPTVGGISTAKTLTQSGSVFHSPGVNQLQRLNSPMNSPQAMSPYNSPSPSPVVIAPASKAVAVQPTVVAPQPAKSLQYPFPSHPPAVMAPAAAPVTVPPPPPATTVVPLTPPPQNKMASETFASTKPKTNAISKSLSMQDKITPQSSQSVGSTSNRVLCKSASVPGSTNVGTVKSTSASTATTLPANYSNNNNNNSTKNDDSSSTKCGYQRSVSNTSKKGDKAHKHNHRNDSDKKMSKSEKSRSESIDKRKSQIDDSDDTTSDTHEKDNERLEEDRRKREPEEKESLVDHSVQERAEKDKDRGEREKLQKSERERRDKEKRRDKEEKEREERERQLRAEKEREELELERERYEQEERDRKEQEEHERKEHEERIREEKLRKERERREQEERERREIEESERKEREERERREKEERECREREERERREKEEREQREREDRERREKEREERERREKEREERERREKEREEREQREKEDRERKEREDRERREREDRERKEKEERERREKERDERERREKEKEEIERREREARDREEYEVLERKTQEEQERRERKDQDDTERRERADREDRRSHFENDDILKEQSDSTNVGSKDAQIQERKDRNDEEFSHFRPTHHNKDDKINKDTNENLSSIDEHMQKRRERRNSANSPIRMTKRRLSSQESIEPDDMTKRLKTCGDNRKILDRRDSKDPTRSSKHHKSHSRANSLSKNSEEKLLNSEERYRKDSGFDEKKSKEKDRDKEHKKYEKDRTEKTSSSSHKYKKHSSKDESIEKDEEIRSSTEKILFDSQDLRSSEEEQQILEQHQQQRHRNKKEHKEKKRHEYEDDGNHRQTQRIIKSESKRHDSNRHENSRHERKSTGRSEDSNMKVSSEKIRNKPLRKLTQSSNDSDSDEPKKHSIFDILDDGPFVSMYDKVKARSCKNMQKQEEEKKIKAKFTQLKQSRAKREEKKRSTSYDGDSDSDFDDRQAKYKMAFKMSRGGFINSSSDEGTINRNRDNLISDSDSDARRAQYNRERLNELCDGDSSDGGILLSKSSSCKKISTKRNSRSTRIVSDSSDAEILTQQHRVKNENVGKIQNCIEEIAIKTEMKHEDEDENMEGKTKGERFQSIKSEKLKREMDENPYSLKVEIKTEPKEIMEDFFGSQLSENETTTCSGYVESKDSVFDQLFSPEMRKKHKKSKKRQKLPSLQSMNDGSVTEKSEDVKIEKHSPTSMEHVFDELKRETTVTSTGSISGSSTGQFSEKKKHRDRKEKKRDKSREEYDKSSLTKEERHRIKKSKKLSKNDGERHVQDSTSSGVSVAKRGGEKMEDIFGPISDDETQLSGSESIKKEGSSTRLYENLSGHTQQPVVSAALNPYKQEPVTPTTHNTSSTGLQTLKQEPSIPTKSHYQDPITPKSHHTSSVAGTGTTFKQEPVTPKSHHQSSTPNNPYKQEPLTPKSHTVEENEENKQKASSHTERERHRKEKREKKRKERDRTREQQSLSSFQQKTEDENSVDLDEAGRALEAQLMEDSDNKLTDETTPSTATTHKSDMADVFRFSDGDENSMEVVTQEKKEQSEIHKTKEKKKKKKRSKEERHQRREHHHHSASHSSSNVTATPQASSKLSIDVNIEASEDAQEPICKPSPSLPCLLDESPPRKNNSSSELNLPISPMMRETNIISPIPKTPTVSSSKTSECKKKPDKFIPGFDVELDEKISESAVKSISAEFTSPVLDPIQDEPNIAIESPPESKSVEKIEEKSRVIISQEETEDAVAALLGESFGTSSTADYSFTDDPCEIQPEEECIAIQAPIEPIIPEEEAEEMRKAVQSLSNEEIEIKPDTPQSEQDLQIDTDTEEPDEEPPTSQLRFDNPPKTPDVHLSQIKPSQEPNNKLAAPVAEDVIPQKIVRIEERAQELPNTASVITKNTNDLKPIPGEKSKDVKIVLSTESQKSNIEKTEVEKPESLQKPPTTPAIVQKITSITSSMPRTQVVFTTTQRIPKSPIHPASSGGQPKIPVSRSQSQFMMQPPTISIPEQTHFMYPPINVVVSPRGAGEHRMQSPRHSQPSATITQSPSTQFVNVRVSSPQSPSVHRGQQQNIRHPSQLSPVMPPHVVIQQRQLMSPPGSSQPSQSPNVITSSTGNMLLNRIPVTSVLAPISKPIQPTSIILPQPNSVQPSMVNRIEIGSDNKESKPIGQATAFQSVRVGTPTSGSAGSPVNTPSQSQSATTQQPVQPIIKSVIETHGHQIVPIQVHGQKPNHQTVVLQQQIKPHITQSQPQRPALPMQPMSKIAQQQQLLQQHHMIQQRHHQMQLQQHQQKQMQQQQQAQQHAQMIQMQKQLQKHTHQQQQHQQLQQQQQKLVMHQHVLQMHSYQTSQSSPAKDSPHKSPVSMPQIIQNVPSKEVQVPLGQQRVQQNVVVVRQQPSIVQQQQLQKPTQSVQQSSQPELQKTTLPSNSTILQQKVHQSHQQLPTQNVVQPTSVKTQQEQVQTDTSASSKIAPNTLPQSHVDITKSLPSSDSTKVSASVQMPVSVPVPITKSSDSSVAKSTEKIEKLDEMETTIPTTQDDTKVDVSSELHLEKSSDDSEKPKSVATSNVDVRSEVKTESITLSSKLEPENVSVIKSQTAATPVQPIENSLLTEENVSKFTAPADEQLEQDSKEDSDYWSAKELNIDSVIKKVDALCSNDDEVDVKSQENKVENIEAEKVSVPSEVKESPIVEESIIKPNPESELKVDSQTCEISEAEKNEDTHDEEEFEEGIAEAQDSGKSNRGGKRGRINRGGKKISTPSVPVNAAVEGVQTRRGKNTQRGGRRGRAVTCRGASNAVVTVGEKKMRNQTSDQDIYEFHDDSGEETSSSKSSERPRLILTIKSPAQASSTVVHTKPIIQQQQQPVSATAPSTPPQTQLQDPSIPSQKDQKESKEEFSTPAANTRKSRRLLEKDGCSRTTVDDIIDDVVRNSSSPKSGGQTPPRRSTRNSQNPTTIRTNVSNQLLPSEKCVNPTDIRKSPRANRRTKDRKASETSVDDSSDEKASKPEEKISKSQHTTTNVEGEKETLSSGDVEIKKDELLTKVETTENALSDQSEKAAVATSEPSEPLTLIDPVTGLLTVVRQSKEGQYVPVAGTSNPVAVVKPLLNPSTSPVILSAPVDVKPVLEESKQKSTEPPKVIPIPEISVSNPKSVAITHKLTSVVVSSSQQPAPSPPIPTVNVSQPQSQVVVQSKVQVLQPKLQQQQQQSQPLQSHPAQPQQQLHPTQKSQPQPVQQPVHQQQQVSQPQLPQQQIPQQQQQHPQSQAQPPQQQQHSQHIRTHPLKAHVLSSQMNKPVVTQGVVKVGSGILGQTAPVVVTTSNVTKQQSTIIPTNIVARHSIHQPQQSQHHNLVVNIPQSNSPHQAQMNATHSPRIQQNVVIKTQQSQQPTGQQQSQSQPQMLHVVTKPLGQTGQIISQHQPVVIHGNKIQQSQVPYSVQSGKVIQQVQSPVTIQSTGKHQTIQVSMPHVQQHPHGQKQNPTISVVTHQVTKQVAQSPSSQQPSHQSHAAASQQHHMSQHITNVVSSGGVKQQVPSNALHIGAGQQSIVLGSQHIVAHAHQSSHPHQPTGATLLQAKPAHQQHVLPPTKGVIGLHQTPQIMTGAVASPPLKQSHMASQQPVVTGASSLRASVPPISPQGQTRTHMLQPGLPAPAFEANLGESSFATGAMRGISREHYIMYQPYYRAQEARIPYIPRSTLIAGSDQKDLSDLDESLVASPPLELRRPGSGSRTIAVPHSLQSPQDRATDSPQVAQVYVHGTRIPHPHFQDVGARFFESVRQVAAEPPPAHRLAHSVAAPTPPSYAQQSGGPPATLSHIHSKAIEREREQREREKERASIPGHTSMPSHGSLVPAMPAPTGRNIQVATPPHASQVPPQADSLLMLLQRYPLMWQGLLALKTDQAAVQMHFVFGNPHVARGSLPQNSDGSTPPLRIAQRMRLEQTQLEGVAKKMQYENEHCMLLALPCGRDHMDVLQQSRNLQTGFITYLQQKMAAGIVNIPVPGSEQAAFVVHIFPSCDFANENLERAAPDLKHRLAEIAHLLIVIATV